MLVGHQRDFSDQSTESFDFLQQHLQEMGKDFLSKRIGKRLMRQPRLIRLICQLCLDEGTNESEKPNTSELNEKLKASLTQHNVVQLLEKLLNNHRSKDSKKPKIVVVAPIASQSSRNVSNFFETRVTTTKPKAFDLKVIPAPSNREKQADKVAAASKSQKKRPSSSTSANKNKKTSYGERKTSSSSEKKPRMPESTTHGTTTVSSTKSNKNFKVKIYEKEIDMLLQKIEKLENQQNVKVDGSKPMPSALANSKLLNGTPMDIAQKLKSFIGVSGQQEERPEEKEQMFESSQWQPTQDMMPMPPLPLPPPMPFMPFMPPMQYPPFPPLPDGSFPPDSPYPENPEPQSPEQPNYDQYQMNPMDTYQQQQQAQPQQYSQPMPQAQPPPSQPLPQQPQQQPISYQQLQQQLQPQLQPQQQPVQPEQSYNQNQIYQNQVNSQASQAYPVIQQVEQEPPKKKKLSNLFRRKFKLSNIFGRSKNKPKETTEEPNDNRNIQVNPPLEQMLTQESQVHSMVDRAPGYGYEYPGSSMSFGGGPMGGGGQVKVSPMGLLKTIILPLMPKPRMNLNGKVVFGVVLENGVGFGKKPKTVFQHFSTGRIRR